MAQQLWTSQFSSRWYAFMDQSRRITSPFVPEGGITFPRYVRIPKYVDRFLPVDNPNSGYFMNTGNLRLRLWDGGIVQHLLLRFPLEFNALNAIAPNFGVVNNSTNYRVDVENGYVIPTNADAAMFDLTGSSEGNSSNVNRHIVNNGMAGKVGLDYNASTTFTPYWTEWIELRSREMVLGRLYPQKIEKYYRQMENRVQAMEQVGLASLWPLNITFIYTTTTINSP